MTRRDIVTAIPTSFRADGSLDVEGTRSIFRYVAKSGNEGAFVLGTTGEFPAIDDAEFETIVGIALEELSAAMRVIVHVGQPSAFEAVRRVKLARAQRLTRRSRSQLRRQPQGAARHRPRDCRW